MGCLPFEATLKPRSRGRLAPRSTLLVALTFIQHGFTWQQPSVTVGQQASRATNVIAAGMMLSLWALPWLLRCMTAAAADADAAAAAAHEAYAADETVLSGERVCCTHFQLVAWLMLSPSCSVRRQSWTGPPQCAGSDGAPPVTFHHLLRAGGTVCNNHPSADMLLNAMPLRQLRWRAPTPLWCAPRQPGRRCGPARRRYRRRHS